MQDYDISQLAQELQIRKRRSPDNPYVLFLGAGVSKASGIGSYIELIDNFLLDMKLISKDELSSSSEIDRYKMFHAQLEDLDELDKFPVLQHNFINRRPSLGYLSLIRFIEEGYFTKIITTNWDNLLELSLESSLIQKAKYQFQVIGINKEEIIVRDFFEKDLFQVQVLKIHGDFDRKEINPGDKDRLPLLIEEHLKSFLKKRDIIMIGYSLSDSDIVNCVTEQNDRTLIYVNPKRKDHRLFRSFTEKYKVFRRINGKAAEFDTFMNALCEATLYEKAYNRQMFINRNDEESKLKNLLISPNRELPKLVFEVKGIGGIGKSLFLRKILTEFRKDRNKASSKKNKIKPIVVYYDFDNITIAGSIKDISVNLINQIKNAIGDEISRDEIFTANTSGVASKAQLIFSIKQLLNNPKIKLPVIIIFDSLEKSKPATKKWVIEIIEEFVDHVNSVFFILGSKRSANLENSSHIKHFYSLSIEEFTQEDSLQQIKKLNQIEDLDNVDNSGYLIHDITKGHPLANELVIEKYKYKNEHGIKIFEKRANELIGYLFKNVIDNSVFGNFTQNEVIILQELLYILSIPRQFNLVSMNNLITKFSPSLDLGLSLDFGSYIPLLQKDTSFIRYSKEKSAYVVNPFLRKMFYMTLRKENRKKFNQINKFLIKQYEKWIFNTSGTDRMKFFLEKLYHLTSLNHKTIELTKFLNELDEFIDIIVKEAEPKDVVNIKQQLYEEFKHDVDLYTYFDDVAKREIETKFQSS